MEPIRWALVGRADLPAGSVAVDLIVGPDGRYSEQLQSGLMMTMDSGFVTDISEGIVHFTVQDFEPRESMGQLLMPPPGATYSVEFTSPTTMIFQDLNYGGIVYFERAP